MESGLDRYLKWYNRPILRYNLDDTIVFLEEKRSEININMDNAYVLFYIGIICFIMASIFPIFFYIGCLSCGISFIYFSLLTYEWHKINLLLSQLHFGATYQH